MRSLNLQMINPIFNNIKSINIIKVLAKAVQVQWEVLVVKANIHPQNILVILVVVVHLHHHLLLLLEEGERKKKKKKKKKEKRHSDGKQIFSNIKYSEKMMNLFQKDWQEKNKLNIKDNLWKITE